MKVFLFINILFSLSQLSTSDPPLRKNWWVEKYYGRGEKVTLLCVLFAQG